MNLKKMDSRRLQLMIIRIIFAQVIFLDNQLVYLVLNSENRS